MSYRLLQPGAMESTVCVLLVRSSHCRFQTEVNPKEQWWVDVSNTRCDRKSCDRGCTPMTCSRASIQLTASSEDHVTVETSTLQAEVRLIWSSLLSQGDLFMTTYEIRTPSEE